LARLCVAPVVAGLVAFGSCLTLLFLYLPALVEFMWPQPTGRFLLIIWTLFEVVVFVAMLVAGLALSYIVQSLLAAPFNDLISERVERLMLPEGPPETGWRAALRAAGRAVSHEARKGLLWLSAAAPLFLLSWLIPGIGALIWSVGSFYITVRFVAYDALDYSMGRRSWSFQRKIAFLREHRALAFGLGGVTTLLLAVPLVGLAASPLAAVGGTALFCDISSQARASKEESGVGCG
jgi:CysZ protein